MRTLERFRKLLRNELRHLTTIQSSGQSFRRCRFYAVGPPGSLFFVMAAAIGAYTPVPVEQLPTAVGLIALGALLACIIAFLYSVYTLRAAPRLAAEAAARPNFDYVVFDSVVIGACVGISLPLAQLFDLERPYWVPVSCLAVIQGASLRAVWNRQLAEAATLGQGSRIAGGHSPY